MSSPILIEQIRKKIAALKFPHLSQNLVSLKRVEKITVQEKRLTLILKVTPADIKHKAIIEDKLREAFAAFEGIDSVKTIMTHHSPAKAAPKPRNTGPQSKKAPPKLKGVSHVIAVASGKGGVGKSTVSINLAISLAQKGLKVGVLDCDIYGPSLHHMMGEKHTPNVTDENLIIPVKRHGICAMSLGYLLEESEAVVWRGPMLMGAVKQLINGVAWSHYGPLDVLIVDMPPGTGDVPLSVAQSIEMTGAIVVTTPQDIALIDVKKGIDMFNRISLPILGIVENMSEFICPHCREASPMFGKAGGQRLARNKDIPFLGAIPMHIEICEKADSGAPAASVEGADYALPYHKIAEKLITML